MRTYAVFLCSLAAATCLSSCGQDPEAKRAEEIAAATSSSADPAPRFSPAAVEAMTRQLRGEPKIKDLTFNPASDAVTWQIGVVGDGSRRVGYAQYVCQELAAKSLVDGNTNVRIVDLAELTRTNGDARAASIGHVSCADGSDMGD